MKKVLIICALCSIALAGAACASEEPPAQQSSEQQSSAQPRYDLPVKDGLYIIEDEQMGLSFGIPIQQLEDHTIYFGKYFLPDGAEDTPPLDGMQVVFFPPGLLEEAAEKLQDDPSEECVDEVTKLISTRSRLLYSIQYYSVSLWDGWVSEGKSSADITGNAQNIELGRQSGRIYVYTEPDPKEQGLLEEELPVYRQAVAAIPAMREHAVMLKGEQVVSSQNVFPAFSAKDIYGAAVDNGIFADYELTMLNIWGTFCGPCIMEMPDLGELAAAMPAGTQLVGLVGDALNEENIELAQTIAESTGAAYLHIVPDLELYNFLRTDIVAYPTTLFIDKQGNMVGEPLIGAMDRARYEEALSKRLLMLQ